MPLRSIHFSGQREYNSSQSQLWQLLSHTDHLNYAVGLPHVKFSAPIPNSNALCREASAKAFGFFNLRWNEYPFEWVENKRYSVLRLFESGPLEKFKGGVELSTGKSGTVVKVFADLTPKNLIGYLMALIIGKKGVKNTLKYCEDFLEDVKSKAQDVPLFHKSDTSNQADEKLLDRLLEKLKEMPIQKELLFKLKGKIMTEYDNDVIRMQPFAVAKAWDADRDEVLRLFLYGTKAGIMNMKWELICPNCRVPKAEYEKMGDLTNQFHCDTCGIEYKADLDNYVELRFSVHPAVRQAEGEIYCIGGPFNAPHILTQQFLSPQEEKAILIALTDESLRIRAIPSNQTAPLELRKKRSEEMAFFYDEAGWSSTSQSPTSSDSLADSLNSANSANSIIAQIKFQNRSSKPIVAVIERIRWDDNAATAAYVTSFHEFRNLFSSEVLAPGHEIEIQNLSVLFSDLKGSTDLYESIGDAPAYGRVREHFNFLVGCINQNRGTLVKTIGDAVMAVFARPQDAIRAAMGIQKSVSQFNKDNRLNPPIVIKLGVYHGPAIAVNANDRLDYFGRSVNIAARIQRESLGNDLVLTRAFFEEPESQKVLKEFDFEVETFTARLRGIEGEFELCRLRLTSYG